MEVKQSQPLNVTVSIGNRTVPAIQYHLQVQSSYNNRESAVDALYDHIEQTLAWKKFVMPFQVHSFLDGVDSNSRSHIVYCDVVVASMSG